jgi:hypothetical protein
MYMTRTKATGEQRAATGTDANPTIFAIAVARNEGHGAAHRACKPSSGVAVRPGANDALHQRAHW